MDRAGHRHALKRRRCPPGRLAQTVQNFIPFRTGIRAALSAEMSGQGPSEAVDAADKQNIHSEKRE